MAHPEQETNLRRVRANLGALVLAFCRDRLALGAPVFRIADLQGYVSEHALAAPASPDRILRDLRRRGKVSYDVINRAGSVYRLAGVSE